MGGKDAQTSTDDTNGLPGPWEMVGKRRSRRDPPDRVEKAFSAMLGNVGCILGRGSSS